MKMQSNKAAVEQKRQGDPLEQIVDQFSREGFEGT